MNAVSQPLATITMSVKNIIVISVLKKIHFHRHHGPLQAAGPEAAASMVSIMVCHWRLIHIYSTGGGKVEST